VKGRRNPEQDPVKAGLRISPRIPRPQPQWAETPLKQKRDEESRNRVKSFTKGPSSSIQACKVEK
jgi:hypothetical protein